MVDWSIFWENIFPSFIVLLSGWLLAWGTVHRYQIKKQKKEIKDDLIDLHLQLTYLLAEILDSFDDWTYFYNESFQEIQLPEYSRSELFEITVDSFRKYSNGVFRFTVLSNLLLKRIQRQIKLDELENELLEIFDQNTDNVFDSIKENINEKSKYDELDQYHNEIISLSEDLYEVSDIILYGKVKI